MSEVESWYEHEQRKNHSDEMSQHKGQFHLVWHESELKSGCATHICIDVVQHKISETKNCPVNVNNQFSRGFFSTSLIYSVCKTICFRLQAYKCESIAMLLVLLLLIYLFDSYDVCRRSIHWISGYILWN